MTSFSVNGIFVKFKDAIPTILQRNVVSTTIRALKDHQNCMIESPEGTDRLFHVLTSVISFQKSQITIENEPPTVLDPVPGVDVQIKAKRSPKPGEYPQIICVCRDGNSLTTAIEHIKHIEPSVTTCVLADISTFCLNDNVNKHSIPHFWCSSLQSTNSCPFSKNRGNFPYNQNLDIEEIRDFCMETRECPYLREKEFIRTADVILTTAEIFFNFSRSIDYDIYTDQNILVFEDMPNIEMALLDTATFTYTLNECEEMLPKRTEFAELIDFLKGFDTVITNKSAEIAAFGEQSEVLSFDDFFSLLDCDINWVKCNKCIESMREIAKTEELTTLEIQRKIEDIFKLCEIASNNSNDFIVEIVPENAQENIQNHMVFCCLSLGPIFRHFTSFASSIIFTSNVLSPMTKLADSLGTKFEVFLSSPVTKEESFQAFTLGLTTDSVPFQNTLSQIAKSGDVMFTALAKLFDSLLPHIPDGVILYAMEPNEIIKSWKKTDILKKLKKHKPVFYPSQNEKYIDNFRESCVVDNGGLLITSDVDSILAMKGKQIRLLFIFGISRNDTHLSELIREHRKAMPQNETQTSDDRQSTNKLFEHSDEPKKLFHSLDWSEYNGLRNAFEMADAVIDGPGDFGSVVFVDSRYPLLIDRFPHWLKQATHTSNSPTHLLKNLKTFFAKVTPSEKEFELTTNKQILFVCPECGENLLQVKKLNTIDTKEIEKPGFLSLISAEGPTEVLPISPDITKRVLVKPSEIEWKTEDQIGYTPLKCQCGNLFGAEITVFSVENESLADETWLLKERVVPTNPLSKKNEKQKRSLSQTQSPQSKSRSSPSRSQPKPSKKKKKEDVQRSMSSIVKSFFGVE